MTAKTTATTQAQPSIKNRLISFLLLRSKPQVDTCAVCGTPLEQLQHGRRKKYCSKQCRIKSWKMSAPRPVQLTCPVYNKKFRLTAGDFRGRTRRGTKTLYCSRKCSIQHRKGLGKSKDIVEYVKSHPKDKKWTQNELAKIFSLSRERIRQIRQEQHLEKYIKARVDTQVSHLCRECSKPITKNPYGQYNKFCSNECRSIPHRTTIELKCHVCGKKFTWDRSQYNNTMKKRRLPYRFCSKKCFGKYAGEKYGFATHPRNIYPRKYDYDAVVKLTNDGLTPRQISDQLSIPINILYTIRATLKLPKIQHPNKKYDITLINSIKELYVSKHTPKEVSEILGIPISSLYNINHQYSLSKLIQRHAHRKYDYDAISDMYKSGLKPKNVIVKLGITSSTLTKINRRLGIPKFPQGITKIYDHDKIEKMYTTGMNAKQIADKLSMSYDAVYNILHKTKRRSVKE